MQTYCGLVCIICSLYTCAIVICNKLLLTYLLTITGYCIAVWIAVHIKNEYFHNDSGFCHFVRFSSKSKSFGACSFVLCRFRLISKSLAAFLAAQMPSDASLRVSADAPGAIDGKGSTVSSPQRSSPPRCSPSQQARQTYVHLESLRTNKQYTSVRDVVDMAIEMVASPQMSLRDTNMFLSRLVAAVFPDVSYLEIIRTPSLWVA